METWVTTSSFLSLMVERGVLNQRLAGQLPNMLRDTLKRGHRRREQPEPIAILNGFRILGWPRLVINFFLFLPAASWDPRAWILFVSALQSSCGTCRLKPSHAAMALWTVRHTRTTVARQFPAVYTICLQVCMREVCPRRVITILRCMQRDGATNHSILQQALLWYLKLEHFECSLAVLRLIKRMPGEPERDSVTWSLGPVRHAPRIVRHLHTNLKVLGLISEKK
jgi:hypothetical protein